MCSTPTATAQSQAVHAESDEAGAGAQLGQPCCRLRRVAARRVRVARPSGAGSWVWIDSDRTHLHRGTRLGSDHPGSAVSPLQHLRDRIPIRLQSHDSPHLRRRPCEGHRSSNGARRHPHDRGAFLLSVGRRVGLAVVLADGGHLRPDCPVHRTNLDSCHCSMPSHRSMLESSALRSCRTRNRRRFR